MKKFIADESVDFRIIKFLRQSGYEITAIREEKPSIDDDKVLEFASSLEAALITEDKDFGELTIRQRKPNFGIILLRLSGVHILEKNEILLNTLQNHGEKLLMNFTVVTRDKIRIRKL